MFDIKANVEMLPMVIYIFILVIILFVMAFVVAPITTIIAPLAAEMDTSGSIYVDVLSTFNLSISAWYYLLVMMVVVKLAHLALLAIKKQRSEGEIVGGYSDESDF